MKISTRARIFGGFVLLFNFWLIGSYHVSGVPLFLMTFGFAIGFEVFVIRKISSALVDYDMNQTSSYPSDVALSNVPKHSQLCAVAAAEDSIYLAEYTEKPATITMHDDPISARGEVIEVDEDKIWVQVLGEYESTARRPGLWARVFANAEGNESLAKARYLRERVDELLEQGMSEAKTFEQERAVQTEIMKKKIEHLKHAFLAGKRLGPEDIAFLAKSSNIDKSLCTISERFRGETILHLCARYELVEEVSVLLKNGADPNARNGDGQTAASLASRASALATG